MIDANTASRFSTEEQKYKEGVWLELEELITAESKAGKKKCTYTLYPDASISAKELEEELCKLDFIVQVYNHGYYDRFDFFIAEEYVFDIFWV